MRTEPRHPKPESVHPELARALSEVRSARRFNPERVLAAKSELIRSYWGAHDLSRAVLGLSGGVDSAVALGLLVRALGAERVIGVTLPEAEATRDQELSVELARETAERFGARLVEASVSGAARELAGAVESGIGLGGEGWARGQLASYVRTPALYYVTSLLTEAGESGVVCGTTNRDEGAWLGYFGKASDGMVDVQLIADLHKSEVYKLAELLGVPERVNAREPVGDMWDGRSDVEVFGASYDLVELYLNWLNSSADERQRIASEWSEGAREQFRICAENLERLHSHNAHKYLGAGQSGRVHLNVLQSGVAGGWGQ